MCIDCQSLFLVLFVLVLSMSYYFPQKLGSNTFTARVARHDARLAQEHQKLTAEKEEVAQQKQRLQEAQMELKNAPLHCFNEHLGIHGNPRNPTLSAKQPPMGTDIPICTFFSISMNAPCPVRAQRLADMNSLISCMKVVRTRFAKLLVFIF